MKDEAGVRDQSTPTVLNNLQPKFSLYSRMVIVQKVLCIRLLKCAKNSPEYDYTKKINESKTIRH